MPDGNRINLTFLDFHSEPDLDEPYDCQDDQSDYMEISYGDSYKRYCGTLRNDSDGGIYKVPPLGNKKHNKTFSLPGPFITCDNIKVKFSSDDDTIYRGFQAVWSLKEDIGNIILIF